MTGNGCVILADGTGLTHGASPYGLYLSQWVGATGDLGAAVWYGVRGTELERGSLTRGGGAPGINDG
ncbi:hypothetical protein WDL1CHR_01191 [Variovorax sp. WDL1]|nr:hypothetical protein CHC07_02436 [Variovorax sp. B4]PNG57446.1 hypothetical protein CHC06_02439 [Variovorax sp. B2]VTV10178.1 hypothetical protein WDL1CHR_01191 [Variovorax sp. WDL1]